jgi:hypothetical protein
MAEADDKHTPIAPLDARLLPEPEGWMWIGDAFSLVTYIVGDPEESLYEIWRKLLAGQVRSMRQRPLNDSIEQIELPRVFWRDIGLSVERDQGREVVGYCRRNGVDFSFVEKAVVRCIFYLLRADVLKTWPPISEPPGHVEKEPADEQVVVSATAPEPPPEPKTKHDRTFSILDELHRKRRLSLKMQPRDVRKMVLPAYHKRWPGDEPSPRVMQRAYEELCALLVSSK